MLPQSLLDIARTTGIEFTVFLRLQNINIIKCIHKTALPYQYDEMRQFTPQNAIVYSVGCVVHYLTTLPFIKLNRHAVRYSDCKITTLNGREIMETMEYERMETHLEMLIGIKEFATKEGVTACTVQRWITEGNGT